MKLSVEESAKNYLTTLGRGPEQAADDIKRLGVQYIADCADQGVDPFEAERKKNAPAKAAAAPAAPAGQPFVRVRS